MREEGGRGGKEGEVERKGPRPILALTNMRPGPLGATKPEEFGDYFAWGETEPKERYSWDNYKFGSDPSALNKYCDDDGKMSLDLEDEAANKFFAQPFKSDVNEYTGRIGN